MSSTIRSNFIIFILSEAFSALSAVVTKKLFSFKNFLTNDLIPSSSSTTKICAKNYPLIILFNTLSKLTTSSEEEFKRAE